MAQLVDTPTGPRGFSEDPDRADSPRSAALAVQEPQENAVQPVRERSRDEDQPHYFAPIGESFRFDLSRPLIRPAWSDQAACFVHAAGGCHLPQSYLRKYPHPLLETICSLRRLNFSSNHVTLSHDSTASRVTRRQ